MVYQIIEDEIDMSGTHRVRVIISPEETIFLRYKQSPNQNTVDKDVEKVLEERKLLQEERELTISLDDIPMI